MVDVLGALSLCSLEMTWVYCGVSWQGRRRISGTCAWVLICFVSIDFLMSLAAQGWAVPSPHAKPRQIENASPLSEAALSFLRNLALRQSGARYVIF